MSLLSEQVRAALYGKMNVTGVTTLATGIYHGIAPDTATYPFITFSRSAPGAVERTFSSGAIIEDDLWMVKATTDAESAGTSSPQSKNEAILSAIETAIGGTLTLTSATALWVLRFSDIPELFEVVNDRKVWTNGMLLRVVSQ